ncbi:PAS-domain containing protein [Aquincola tertiaricarbonis]|uniref:PAS-domain containing protein n=1 Tax=Aquincola tertiaricarbonis TaxID=391953 RepID=A0ABY4S4R7_AQUTE|nr:PAS-domain containing protein [Aquincola tertiaricarbonis]URI07690.1 PAS-domain containing protein [Aquincola tertiaricarbonis]
MKDALLVAIGAALDGVDVGFCAFDHQNRTIGWNATFLSMFPEHEGHVHVGAPYAENLRRFYSLGLQGDQVADIDRYIAEGILRHQTQRRPYEFDHRDFRVRVSSFEIGTFGRLRVWCKVAMLPTHVKRPTSTTQALEGLDVTCSPPAVPA